MKEYSVAFTGDIAFSRYYRDRYEKTDLVDPELKAFLNTSDCTVLNIEGAVCRPTQSGLFIHNNPPEAVPHFLLFKGKENCIWNLANNHVMDSGPEGCMETIALARQNGCMTVGAGANEREAIRPAVLPQAGGIGIIGLGYQPKCIPADETTPGCSSWDKTELIRETVRQIKKDCRWCVAVIHGGREFCDIPMQDIRDRYHALIDMGVDAVVAHHPHVPQNYESVGGKLIFYSLGNFIFDTDYQRAQFHTDTGVLVRLVFTDTELRFDAVGTRIDRESGRVSRAALPAVFTAFEDRDYAALYPLAAKRFLEHIVRRVAFTNPDEFHTDPDEEMMKAIIAREHREFPHFDLVLTEAARFDENALEAKYAPIREYLI